MTKIFLSYRRQDSAGAAGRIYDRLRTQFGADNVFVDIDSIPYGLDFRVKIASAVDEVRRVAGNGVIPGATGRGEYQSRLVGDPGDFVRIEIEAALERKLPVIPILIDHATMPRESDLPSSLAPLAVPQRDPC